MTKIKFEKRALSIGDILERGYLKQLPQYAYLFPSSISNAFIIVIVKLPLAATSHQFQSLYFRYRENQFIYFFFNLLMVFLYSRFKRIFPVRIIQYFSNITTTFLFMYPSATLYNFLRSCFFSQGLSKNYVVKNEGMKSTFFSALGETLFSSESSCTPKTQPKCST